MWKLKDVVISRIISSQLKPIQINSYCTAVDKIVWEAENLFNCICPLKGIWRLDFMTVINKRWNICRFFYELVLPYKDILQCCYVRFLQGGLVTTPWPQIQYEWEIWSCYLYPERNKRNHNPLFRAKIKVSDWGLLSAKLNRFNSLCTTRIQLYF